MVQHSNGFAFVLQGGRGGRGRGRGARGGRGRGKEDQKEWVPVTKLGRLVREGKIRSLEEIYLYSLPIKEFEIIDTFLGSQLKDEVLKIMPVQKQTRAGQRTRFKAFVAIGDSNGHIGLGVKCSKEVATAIRGAIILAKLSVVPVRRGYWGNKIGKPHTVPCKVSAFNYLIEFHFIFQMMRICFILMRFTPEGTNDGFKMSDSNKNNFLIFSFTSNKKN